MVKESKGEFFNMALGKLKKLFSDEDEDNGSMSEDEF